MGKINNILLTGANGFLGSHILRQLLDEGYSPILMLRQSSDLWRIKDLIERCETYVLNDQAKNFGSLFEKYEINGIIHTATEYGRSSSLTSILKTNILLPVELIEQGIKKNLKFFVNTDSFFAKSQYNQSYLNDYTTSKRVLEKLLIGLSDRVKIINLRIEHIYGENDSEEKFVTSILRKLLNNDPEIKLTDGLQKRDFVYAPDVANAFIHVIKNLEKIDNYMEFEIGSGHSITVREFVETMSKATQAKTFLNFGALPTRTGEILNSLADLTKLKKIGWHHISDINVAIDNIIKIEKERLSL